MLNKLTSDNSNKHEKKHRKKEQGKHLNQYSNTQKRPFTKSFEVKYNKIVRCMELYILDSDGMYPFLVRDDRASKVYCVERTKGGGLKMSAI